MVRKLEPFTRLTQCTFVQLQRKAREKRKVKLAKDKTATYYGICKKLQISQRRYRNKHIFLKIYDML